MGLAFWRIKKRTGNAAAKPATRTPNSASDDTDARLEPAAALRARARHRLIGAAALLLAVAVIVPMLLDPEPRPVPENIPIDIPSERTPFTPRLSLPPIPAPDNVPIAPPPDAPPSEGKAAAKGDDAKTAAEEQRARTALEGKASDALPIVAKGGKFAVQAAAPANEKAARELADRLKANGFAAFTEKVETREGARYRVRVGPYATRDDAERVRVRLKSVGLTGNLVTL
jgi:DedD protein